MNLQALQDFLNNTPIPIKENRTGFLEMIGKQTSENINSNLYAYFINSDEPGVSQLFLNSLTEIINDKTERNFSFSSPFAHTEYPTKNGRIDILIADSESDSRIIIENKIHHGFYNDLDDYWESIPVKVTSKIGVYLTLEADPKFSNVNFLNITHCEWITRMKQKGIPEDISQKTKYYIEDFINTIENLTKEYEMNEQAKFFFENSEKIKEIEATTRAGHQHLLNHLQIISSSLGWPQYGNNLNWRNFWDKDNHIDTYLTIVMEKLLVGELKFKLILELKREDVSKASELEELLKEECLNKGLITGDKKYDYMHFMVKEYTINMEELNNFSETVLQKIKNDFAAITIIAIDNNYQDNSKINLSNWKNNNFWKEVNPI